MIDFEFGTRKSFGGKIYAQTSLIKWRKGFRESLIKSGIIWQYLVGTLNKKKDIVTYLSVTLTKEKKETVLSQYTLDIV